MNNFKDRGHRKGGSRFGGNKKFSGSNKYQGGQDRDNRSSEMFSAVCSDCTKKCNVPFRPSSDKPVFCSECFGMKKSSNETRDSESNRGRSDKGLYNEGQNNTKRPREQRSPRHDPTRGRGDDGIADLKRQITGLEVKLNEILDIINTPQPSIKAPVEPKEETAEKETPKKVVKKVTKKTTVKKVIKKVAKKVTKK